MSSIAVLGHSNFTIGEPYAGGLEMHTHLLCRELTARGHRVTLFAKDGSDDRDYDVCPIVPADYDFHPVPAYSFTWSRQEQLIRRAYEGALDTIEMADFDLVINNSLSPIVMERETHCPQLTILHTPVLSLLEDPARRARHDSLKAFVSVSATNAEGWSSFLPDVQVVLNGIELERWQTSVRRGDRLRWIARIAPEKGLVEAIQAARISGRPLDFAGPISNVDYFESEIRPLMGSDVTYVGHLSHRELPEFYASGVATLVTPQWDEPFGLVVAESLASGTPVAALPRGAMRELVSAGVGAVAVDSSPEALAVAIDVAAAKSGEICRSVAAREFDYRRMVSAYEEILQTMSVGYRLETKCAG